jgi:ATP-dependent exoDNAse (exonuclease V) beta subunit
MLRGRIDLLIRRGRQCEIVDYKTDRVNADELRERTELYRKQLAVYREAVRRTTGYEVSTIYLAFLTAREVIAL